MIAVAGFLCALSAPYRVNRLLSFVNPLRDPQGTSYHINQILIALANGGLFGLGLGQSRQKYEYLPEVATDSIFAIIAEEFGFFGSLILLALFLFLIYKGIQISKRAPDKFGQLLALGIVAWIGLQTIINLGAMVALVPLTGIPLPFISYGGSALITNLAAIGILLNISKHQVNFKK
jgi:cell division protein FtsW